MPWWIWLLLALFMLAMLVAGGVYVIKHAVAALGVISHVGSRMGERLARMGEPSGEEPADEPPTFTQPLTTAAGRYEDAHVGVILRKEARRARHVEAWDRWRDGVSIDEQ